MDLTPVVEAVNAQTAVLLTVRDGLGFISSQLVGVCYLLAGCLLWQVAAVVRSMRAERQRLDVG